MLRLPLTKMASRETDRLPASVIIEKLNADKELIKYLVTREAEIPSDKFFVYHEEPMETDLAIYTHRFKLVQVLGNFEEKVLLYGGATGITYNYGSRYTTFQGRSEKIGNYAFYFPFFDRR